MENKNNQHESTLPQPMNVYINQLVDLDRHHIWHPFTQMKDWESEEPLLITSGDGIYLIDTHGNRYLDGVSSLWVNIHGHRRREINKAIIEQLGKIAHSTLLGLANEQSILLAKRLSDIAPKGLTRVFYSDTGACAVEIAIKMAYQYWLNKELKESGAQTFSDLKYQRTKFVYLENGYHGDTIGSVSVGGIHRFHEIFKPLLFESYKAPSPYCYRCPLGLDRTDCGMACADEMENIVNEHKHEIAAVIVEPLVQGAGGMIVHPEGYLKRVREICTENDVLFIVDEVATGFGRTGKMFACEHENVVPDLMAVAKGISGGYLPLAATLATEEIYNAFKAEYHEGRTFYHGHTYTGNPLACAASIANLELFDKEDTLNKMQEKIKFLKKRLNELVDMVHVGNVRQKGFLVGIELVKNKDTKEPYPIGEKIGIKVIMHARNLGLVIRPLSDVIVLNPPLSSSLDELGEMIDIVKKSIRTVTEK
jgi:adenosylmethionine-8-amino-7-oxononanoate aminotransferase